MSKKSSQQIKQFVLDAEEAGLEWRSCGQEQQCDSLDSLEDPVLSAGLEHNLQSQISAVTTPIQFQMLTHPQYHQTSASQQQRQASTAPQYYQTYTGSCASAGGQHYQASIGPQISTGPQASSSPQHYNTSTGNYASTALFLSHRDVQNINIESITGPPPLIPIPNEGLPLYHSPSLSYSLTMSSQSTSA